MARDLTHHRHHALIQLRFSDFVGRQFGVDTNHVHHVPAEDREVLLAKRFHQTPGSAAALGSQVNTSFTPSRKATAMRTGFGPVRARARGGDNDGGSAPIGAASTWSIQSDVFDTLVRSMIPNTVGRWGTRWGEPDTGALTTMYFKGLQVFVGGR